MFKFNPAFTSKFVTDTYNAISRADMVAQTGTVYNVALIKKSLTVDSFAVAVYIDPTSIPLGAIIREVRLLTTTGDVVAKSVEWIEADSSSGVFYTIRFRLIADLYTA